MDAKLQQAINEYITLDRNPETCKQIKDLIDKKDYEKLKELLGSRLVFGTAGLRAELGAGYSRMNELTVIQASQGVCSYFLESPDFKTRGFSI